MSEFWALFLASQSYCTSAKSRILDGKAPHLETYWVNKIHGKPVERYELSGPEGGPIEVHDHFAVPPPR